MTVSTGTPALVTADWAVEHLGDPAVRFVEVDVDTTAYDQGHLPGAVAWDWTSQLTDGIRRDIATPADISRLLQRRRHRPATRTSSCMATTTTGSPPGPTGSSSCTASTGSGWWTAGASCWLGENLPLTTDVPTLRADGLPAATDRTRELRAFRDEILPRLGDPASPWSTCARRPSTAARSWRRQACQRRRRRGGHIPGAAYASRGPGGTRGRHVQVRRRARRALRGQGRHRGQGRRSPTAASASARRHTWFVLHELLGYPPSATTTAPGPSGAAWSPCRSSGATPTPRRRHR